MNFITVPKGRPFKSFEEFSLITGFKNGDLIDIKHSGELDFISDLKISTEKNADFANEPGDLVIGHFPYTFAELEEYYLFFCPTTRQWTYFGVPYILQEDLRKIGKTQEESEKNFLKFRIGQIYYSDSNTCYAVVDRFKSFLNEKEYLVLFCTTHPSFTKSGQAVEVKKSQDFELTYIETPQGTETLKACFRNGN